MDNKLIGYAMLVMLAIAIMLVPFLKWYRSPEQRSRRHQRRSRAAWIKAAKDRQAP
jgi:Flp pilus assembly protein TadB